MNWRDTESKNEILLSYSITDQVHYRILSEGPRVEVLRRQLIRRTLIDKLDGPVGPLVTPQSPPRQPLPSQGTPLRPPRDSFRRSGATSKGTRDYGLVLGAYSVESPSRNVTRGKEENLSFIRVCRNLGFVKTPTLIFLPFLRLLPLNLRPQTFPVKTRVRTPRRVSMLRDSYTSRTLLTLTGSYRDSSCPEGPDKNFPHSPTHAHTHTHTLFSLSLYF